MILNDFDKIYSSIQDVTNDINMCIGMEKLTNSNLKKETLERMNHVKHLSNELSTTAHELIEHLTWDIK